ncbi:S1 family peptidase [Vibrio methylphosphonaticus]|uniref:S1 family peptidase n=1 Tax=Vibrio methylphosphonaticus TaxID=2946866 RepID=UPI00202A487F|nr:trypsin-like serine protease [Vibrio methylphosphonaticus]MCL9773731.1 trypsin-like serine protease [Vibrio methylphosphonaticus]
MAWMLKKQTREITQKILLAMCALGALPIHAEDVDIAPMIVNGEDANAADYPSYVGLYIDSSEYDGRYSGGAYCGGTLLNSEYVLTAAHCIEGDLAAGLFTTVIPMLENERNFLNADRRRVVEVYIHPSFSNNITALLPNDVAVLKLETSTSSGTAATLASSESYRSSSNTFTAVGHGNVRSNVEGTTILQRANLVWVNNSVCGANFRNGGNLTDKQVCFTGAVSQSTGLKAGTCQGDSGGPIYWDDAGVQTQVGITSFGPSTCGDSSSAVTAVYTEVSDYRVWITQVTDGLETPRYVSDDLARSNYVAQYGQVVYTGGTFASGGEGGGGSVGLFWLGLLMGGFLIRKLPS